MVNFGKLTQKAKDLAEKNGDKIASAVNKATDVVDKKTKGKYSDKLEKLDEAARKLDKTPRADGETSTEGDASEGETPPAPPTPAG
jgi:hypothetical protein